MLGIYGYCGATFWDGMIFYTVAGLVFYCLQARWLSVIKAMDPKRQIFWLAANETATIETIIAS